MVCVMFMAGGLFWTASVGLLTVSALTAYPMMVMVGLVLSFAIFGVATWTAHRTPADSAPESSARLSFGSAAHTYDAVTGLPMYRLLLSLVKQAMSRAERTGRQTAILVIELEHFTPETNAYARLNRNLMYRVQAARVKSALRTTDVVARLAETRFAVLLEPVTQPEEVLALAKKMQQTIAHPITLDEHELLLSCRIGISLSGSESSDARALIEAAERALERTQATGGPNADSAASTAHDSASTIAA